MKVIAVMISGSFLKNRIYAIFKRVFNAEIVITITFGRGISLNAIIFAGHYIGSVYTSLNVTYQISGT